MKIAIPSTLRPVRSFVLRQSRISKGQQRAYRELMPRYGISYAEHPLNLTQVFGRDVPKILEIGFGMGQTTALIAAQHPGNDYLGVEVHTPGVGSLLKLIEEHQLNNIRIIQHDAVEVLQHMIPEGSLSGVHIFFPDPWPKKRHQKRRLIQSPFCSLVSRRLKQDGYLHIATDWKDYADQILKTLSAEAPLKNTCEGFSPRPNYRPLTKFETRGLKLGHKTWDILFIKSGT